ncbi:MAG: BNR-4 repeat-containing protein [Balneolaceae bacterium]
MANTAGAKPTPSRKAVSNFSGPGMNRAGRKPVSVLLLLLILSAGGWNSCTKADIIKEVPIQRTDGYRGIWYADLASDDEFRYVYYSGGLGTYTAKHRPSAYYSKEAEKTFFVYGGVADDGESLQQMISWFDHQNGTLPEPVAILDRKTGDAHDNPSISLDKDGNIWIFASSHGRQRSSYIYKSGKPYSIDSFELMSETNFSYPQPWYIRNRGFLFLHTRYVDGRHLYWSTSRDGTEWDSPRKLAAIDEGHYQISWIHQDKVGTAFNYHPASDAGGNWDNPENPGVNPSASGTNNRTNLYYIETADFGQTWRTADGTVIEPPITSADSPALVRDYNREGLLVYLKDMAFDAEGRPVLLYLTSHGSESGPGNDPRTLRTAFWQDGQWRFGEITTSDNNYDSGSIYVESDGAWVVLAPTGVGPQPYNSGGEICRWVSSDQGRTWKNIAAITYSSKYNHNYVKKPVNGQEDFYGFWADGHARMKSPSRIYFSSKNGTVYRLPEKINSELVLPERVFSQPKNISGDNR